MHVIYNEVVFEIIPGILEKEWEKIESKIAIIKPFAKSIHVDILDGKFAPNTTFLDPAPFAKYSQEFLFELHMMVENPITYLKPFAAAGFKRFLGHIEKMPDQAEFVAKAQALGEAGLAIDGPTPLENIKIPISDLDSLLIMTIKAGWSGQTFNPEHLKKAEILHSAQNDITIEIDGGINEKTILLAKEAGANRFISTSCLFGSQNPQDQYNLLKTLAEK